jgi:hypothetical protein
MKKIYTSRDVDLLLAQGQKEIEVTNDVVVTDVARERAEKAGIKFVRIKGIGGRYDAQSDLHEQVRKAVIARLGSAPDGLDAVIARVLNEALR